MLWFAITIVAKNQWCKLFLSDAYLVSLDGLSQSIDCLVVGWMDALWSWLLFLPLSLVALFCFCFSCSEWWSRWFLFLMPLSVVAALHWSWYIDDEWNKLRGWWLVYLMAFWIHCLFDCFDGCFILCLMDCCGWIECFVCIDKCIVLCLMDCCGWIDCFFCIHRCIKLSNSLVEWIDCWCWWIACWFDGFFDFTGSLFCWMQWIDSLFDGLHRMLHSKLDGRIKVAIQYYNKDIDSLQFLKRVGTWLRRNRIS